MNTKIDKIILDFIWKNKRHEINKNLLCEGIEKGGLNLISLSEMDMCLKITWLHKILMMEPEWLEFATTYRIERLVSTDTTYHTTLYNNTKNLFWKSVISSYTKWYKTFNLKVTVDIEIQPLWGNHHIKIPFNDLLYRKNITKKVSH